jgi:hypothetical protein
MGNWQIPDPAFVKDRQIRSMLEPMRQAIVEMQTGTGATKTNRSLTVDELIQLGILGLDGENVYSRVNMIARSYAQEAAAASGGGGSGSTTSSGGAIITSTYRLEVPAGGLLADNISTTILLPVGSVIVRAWYYVSQAFATDGTACTIGLGVDGDDPYGILPMRDITHPDWAVGLHIGMIYKATSGPPYTNICTAERAVKFTITDTPSTSRLTAGRVLLVCEYLVFT